MSVNKKIIETEATLPSDPQFAVYINQSNSAQGGSITNIGFQPDMMWARTLDRSEYFHVYDSSRTSPTSLYRLNINDTNSESSSTNSKAFGNSAGTYYDPAGNTGYNNASEENMFLFWKFNSGTEVTNNNGAVSSQVQANSTYGMSIIRYTASGGTTTYGHGLSQRPDFIITKARSWANSWFCWVHDGSSAYGGYIHSGTNFSAGNTQVGTPNSTTIGASHIGTYKAGDYVTYAFHSVSGFSKVGSYTGNASSTGPTITTGFEPKWILIRKVASSGNWIMYNSARDSGNPKTNSQLINGYGGESSSLGAVDFNSNNFQIKSNNSEVNASGTTYIYWVMGGNDVNAIDARPNYSN